MTEFRCPECSSRLFYEHDVETRDADETLEGVRCKKCGFVVSPPRVERTFSFVGLPTDPPDPSDPSDPTAAPTNFRLGHFVLERRLGRGAFGEVWLANDDRLDRKVALKLAVTRHGEQADLVHEARAAAQLRHPNIVSVHEVGQEGEHVYIASDYIDGLTLADKLSQGTIEVEEGLPILASVARALHHAHEQGIVHRDVKPANILLDTAGVPYVADFGIAKRISAEATISSDGQVVGTVLYMSPEQASGQSRETDHRADVYAIGVILFEMLTGYLPFRGSVRALLFQKVHEDPPSPRTLRPTIPRDLETICLRCLDREPARRYDSADEVAKEIDRFLEGEPIAARPITSMERAWRWCRRRPLVASLVMGLFLSLSSGLAGVTYFWLQSAEFARRTGESLYRSQMNLSSEYLEAGDLNGVRSVLRRFDDGTPLAHLRGFEWRYLDRATSICHEVASTGDVVCGVAISLDGEYVAACSPGGRITVWEAESGTLVREIELERGEVRGLAFCPTRSRLIAGSSDGFVRIWNPAESGRTLDTHKHGPPVERVRFSPDGKRYLSMGRKGAIRVWTMGKDESVDVPSGMNGATDACFSPDGELLAVASDGSLRIWRIGERPPIVVNAELPELEHVAWSPDGSTIVTTSFGGRTRVVSAETGEVLAESTTPQHLGHVEFANDDFFVTTTNDNRLRVVEVATLHESRRLIAHNLGFGVTALSADGRTLVIGSGDGTVRTVDVRELLHRELHWVGTEKGVRTLALVDGDDRYLAAGPDGVVRLVDIVTGETLPAPPEGGAEIPEPNGLVVVPGPTTSLVDRATGATDRRWEVDGEGAVRAAVAPASDLVAESRGGVVRVRAVWDLSVRFEIPDREVDVEALLFLGAGSGADRELLVAYEDGVIHRHAVEDGATIGEPIAIPAAPRAMTACQEGRSVAIGTRVGVIHVWDRTTQSFRGRFSVHAGPINAIVTLPDGVTVVSGGRDREMVLSNVVALEPIATLLGHERQVFSVAVSRDGRTILSGGLQGDVRVWRTE